jgi:uncharacterized protein (DUF1778 family)
MEKTPNRRMRHGGAILATMLGWPPEVSEVLFMGTIATAKQERIGARVPSEVYQTLNRAAELMGATVNQFLVQSALKEAQAVIEREQSIRLSLRDSKQLLDLLDAPPKPNARLKAATKRYGKAKLANADNSFNWKP